MIKNLIFYLLPLNVFCFPVCTNFSVIPSSLPYHDGKGGEKNNMMKQNRQNLEFLCTLAVYILANFRKVPCKTTGSND